MNKKRSGAARDMKKESRVSYPALETAVRLMRESEPREGQKLRRAVGDVDDTGTYLEERKNWNDKNSPK